jgi:hypothetical protein
MPEAPATREEIEAAVEARIVAYMRKRYREYAQDKDFAGAVAIQETAIEIERGQHRESRDGE